MFVYLNGARRGPFEEERVRTWLRDGVLQSSDLVSEQANSELVPLSTFGRSTPATPPADPMTAIPAAAHVHQPLRSLARESLGPYSRAALTPNELPYYKTTLHWIIFVRFALLALLIFFFLALPFAIAVQALTGSQLGWFVLPLPVFLMVPPALAYVSSELVITDLRVLIKTGIIRRPALELFISKVESVAVDQGLLGRWLDYGSVAIRGTDGRDERFAAIARPLEFRNCVQRIQSSEPPLPAPVHLAS